MKLNKFELKAYSAKAGFDFEIESDSVSIRVTEEFILSRPEDKELLEAIEKFIIVKLKKGE